MNLFINLFWLQCIFIALTGLSLVSASGGYSLLRCMCFSLGWLLLLQSTVSGCTALVAVKHRLSCSVACGIFLVQGSNPCPLLWQADSYPLERQGSPLLFLYEVTTGLWVAHNRGTAFTRVYYLLTTMLRVC